MATRRQLITANGNKRYIRRDRKGRFATYQVDVGRTIVFGSIPSAEQPIFPAIDWIVAHCESCASSPGSSASTPGVVG